MLASSEAHLPIQLGGLEGLELVHLEWVQLLVTIHWLLKYRHSLR